MPAELLSIRTLICLGDDELADQITDILSYYKEFEVLEPCQTGVQAVECIKASRPNLAFVATDLPDMSGFDLIHKLYPVNIPQFIFVAKSEKHAVKAFEYFAFDYIMTPFTNERIHLSLLKVKESFYQKSGGQIQEKGRPFA